MPADSIRVQRYLDSARQWQELASTVMSDSAYFFNAARRWRDLAEEMEEVERKRSTLPQADDKLTALQSFGVGRGAAELRYVSLKNSL